ncbi:MAG: nucleotidyltransferase domain-containing protein [Candidatus Spechtbacteria bacterium]|nr:nucleotidyltransferase domain-containing protein [Candidatus Spechtbacteria bacterium]
MDRINLERALLATFTYYKPLHLYALTPLELMRYLTWAPQDKNQQDKHRISLQEIFKTLDGLIAQKKIIESNGYFFLIESPKNSYWQRIRSRKISVEKRRVFQQIARFYPYIPYVRVVTLTGSVVRDSATADSDIDVLIASAPGRVWLTRFLVGMFTWLLGKYRHKTLICDQICLNHYISIDSNNISKASAHLNPQILSTAHIYAAAMPYWGQDNFKKIGETNEWMLQYMPLINNSKIAALGFKPARLLLAIKLTIEFIMNSCGIGVMLEQSARYFQRMRIVHSVNEKQLEPVQMIIDDNTLLFHYPFSRSKLLEEHFYSNQ